MHRRNQSEGSRVETLDDIIQKHCTSRRIGIKIDTEGHEREVVAGLNADLDRVQFIIAETSVRRRFENGYQFSELVVDLADKGFKLLNFLNRPTPRPLFYDCLFVRADDSRLD